MMKEINEMSTGTMPKTPVYRTVKDRLFKFIFGNPNHKDWALSLYNYLEKTNYTDPDDLEIVTLDNAIYMHTRNDVGVIVGTFNLSLWEQQSAPTPNTPYRLLLYVTDTFKKYVYVMHMNVYSSKPIRLPSPKFYVFYNGKEDAPEEAELKLSDLYYNKDSDPMLELKVKQINIKGYPDSPESCRQLYEYEWFIERIRTYAKETDITEATGRALDEIPADFTIRDELLAGRNDVLAMSLYEYNEEEHLAMEREEAKEEGRKEGIEEGNILATAKHIRILMESSGITFEEACKLFDLSEEEILKCRELF